MKCITYALDPHSMMKTTGSLTQRSVGDRLGVPTCEACPLWKGAHGRCTPNALRLLRWRGELFRWLRFSTFVLSSLQRRERLESLLQTRKNIKFPLLPGQSTESRLPVGTKGKCPPVRINPVVSAAFCLHGSWQ